MPEFHDLQSGGEHVGGYTANLKLTGFAASGDPALTTNLSTFNGLTAGNGNVTFTASLNTSNYTTTGIKTITMSASQLADDSTLPGAGNNNNGGLTITLQGNVGNATADASNSKTAFGAALTALVAQNASYANLESTVTASTRQRRLRHGRQHGHDPRGYKQQRFGPDRQHGVANANVLGTIASCQRRFGLKRHGRERD